MHSGAVPAESWTLSLRFSRLCGVLLVNRRPAFCDTREHRREAKNAEGRIVSFGSGRQAAPGWRLGGEVDLLIASVRDKPPLLARGMLFDKRRRTTMQTRRMAGANWPGKLRKPREHSLTEPRRPQIRGREVPATLSCVQLVEWSRSQAHGS